MEPREGKKPGGNVSSLRIEQVSGSVESPPEVVRVEITSEDQSQPGICRVGGRANSSTSSLGDKDDEEDCDTMPSLSSEQLARRPSFKRILDDLSSADASLKTGVDPLALAAAATLQAQQVALQQAAVCSLANPALIPGLLHGMQTLAAGVSTSSSSSGEIHLPPHIMMQPFQQSLQLQSALLNAASHSSTPLIAGAATVQSLAGQSGIPATLLSNALNMAASLSSNTQLANSNHPSMLTGNSISLTATSPSPTQSSAAGQVVDDQSKKREVRLMKNREAARECRRKKKEYVRCLENRVAVLESQNQALIGELRALKELYLPKSNQD